MPQKNILLLAGAGLVIVAAAFFILRNPSINPSANPMSQTAMGDFSYITDPEVRKHFEAQTAVTDYRITTESSGKQGITITEVSLLGDGVAMKMTEMTGDTTVSEIITMGDYTYLKDVEDGSWWRQQNTPMTETTVPVEETTETTGKNLAEEYVKKQGVTYTSMGTEECGTMMCFKYEESYESDSAMAGGKRTIWFDTSEYLLRKDSMQFGDFITTNEYSYDGVMVQEPSPVKDVPEGGSVYDYIKYDDTMIQNLQEMPDMSPEDLQMMMESMQDPS